MFERICPECGLDRIVSIKVFGEIIHLCPICEEANNQVEAWKKDIEKEVSNAT